MHRDDDLRAHLPDDIRGQVVQQPAIYVNSLSFAHGCKSSGNGHRGSQRHCQRPVLEHVRLSADQVGSHAAKRHGHVVERRNSIVGERDAVNQQPDLMARDQARGSRQTVAQAKNQ